MTRYHSVSGGAGSWLAAKVDIAKHPGEQHRFIFADTLYEDADCYRFLIEGVANLLGRDVSGFLPRVSDFPDYRMADDFDLATYEGNPAWRKFLSVLRAVTFNAMPELIWLVEGRDPWEIFRDRRFLGNSRIDPCSLHGKRELIDEYLAAHGDKTADVVCVGIGTDEAARYTRLAARHAKAGWTYEAPLIGTHEDELGAYWFLHKAGIERPRLYGLGYIHNNCGGFCIKAGHAHYKNRYEQQPERFAYDSIMERKLGEFLGKVVSVMTDRSGSKSGKKRPLTLENFGRRIAADPSLTFDYIQGSSGCGCFTGV